MGVHQSRPASPALLKARASVLIWVATASTRASSKAAPMRMGCGKEVAKLKGPLGLKVTPGLVATPCWG